MQVKVNIKLHGTVFFGNKLDCLTLLYGVKRCHGVTLGRWSTPAMFAKSEQCFNLEVRVLEPGQTDQYYKSTPITKPCLIKNYQNISLHLLLVAGDVDTQVYFTLYKISLANSPNPNYVFLFFLNRTLPFGRPLCATSLSYQELVRMSSLP